MTWRTGQWGEARSCRLCLRRAPWPNQPGVVDDEDDFVDNGDGDDFGGNVDGDDYGGNVDGDDYGDECFGNINQLWKYQTTWQ